MTTSRPREHAATVAVTLPDDLLDHLTDLVEERVLARLAAHRETGPRYLDVPAAARHLGITPNRLRKLVARRAIPFIQEGPGCRIHLDRHDLDHHMATLRHGTRP
jgi:hypothetical protein